MKVFDTEEKAIINKITQGIGYSRTLINIFDSLHNLQGTRIRIDKENKKAEFLFQTQGAEPTDEELKAGIERQKQLVELLIKHVTLFRYLEKEELAIFFEPAKTTEKIIEFGAGAVNVQPFSMSIDDQIVVDLLIKYVNKEIMPSPSLRKLENNNFVSDDEIRFKRQQCVAWTAIIISILLGLYGIINNYRGSIGQQEQFKAQIDENHKIAKMLSDKIDHIEKSKIDYTAAIEKISEELSKINLQNENQGSKK